MNRHVKYFVYFIFLVFIQIFLLNNLRINKYIYPQVYIFFLLLLPVRLHYFWSMLLGFITGFTIDVFTNTPGVHAAVSVLTVFLRPSILRLCMTREGIDFENINIFSLRIDRFLEYVSILCFIHHAILFLIWDISLSEPIFWMIKTVVSTLISIAIMLIFYIFMRERVHKI